MADDLDETRQTTPQTAHLLAAYRAAHYLVHAPSGEFVLRVEHSSPELADLHSQYGVSCSAVITACNPLSQILTDEENTRRQELLGRNLRECGFRTIPTTGRDPTGEWPEEPGYLVPGLSRGDARSHAALFDQLAFLWTGPDHKPGLILTRQANV